jgi:hypothetical protein
LLLRTDEVCENTNMLEYFLKNHILLAYAHPLIVSIWMGLSCVFVQWMSWWPKPEYGFLGYLRPVPAFASIAVPLMFLIDWSVHPFYLWAHI